MRGASVIRTQWFRRPTRRRAKLDNLVELEQGISPYIETIKAQVDETLVVVGIKMLGRLGRADGKVETKVARARTKALRYAKRAQSLHDAQDHQQAMTARLDEAVGRGEATAARRVGDIAYYGLVSGLAVADAVVLSSAFQVLGEGTWLTRLLGLVFAGSLEVIGAFVGAELHRHRFSSAQFAAHRWYGPLVAVGALTVLLGAYGALAMRDAYFDVVLAGSGIDIPQWAVFALQMPIILGAVIVGFLHANPLLDDLDYWSKMARRRARLTIWAHRRLARAVAAHRKVWYRRRSLIGQHLELARAHIARARRDVFAWISRQGTQIVPEHAAARIGEVAEPKWAERLEQDPRFNGSPASDVPDAPSNRWFNDDAGLGVDQPQPVTTDAPRVDTSKWPPPLVGGNGATPRVSTDGEER